LPLQLAGFFCAIFPEFSRRGHFAALPQKTPLVLGTMKSIVGQRSRQLDAFLSCTLDSRSPVRRLRGHEQVLRMIWTLVCEEWWTLHVEQFPTKGNVIPDLTLPWQPRTRAEDPDEQDDFEDPDERTYPRERQRCGGCPVAVIAKNVVFPPPAVVPMGIFENQQSEHLYVNMMPFNPWDIRPCQIVCGTTGP
jgi:hypothetical protein